MSRLGGMTTDVRNKSCILAMYQILSQNGGLLILQSGLLNTALCLEKLVRRSVMIHKKEPRKMILIKKIEQQLGGLGFCLWIQSIHNVASQVLQLDGQSIMTS